MTRGALTALLILAIAGSVAAREFVAQPEDCQCLTNGVR